MLNSNSDNIKGLSISKKNWPLIELGNIINFSFVELLISL